MKAALQQYDVHFGGKYDVTLAANVQEALRAIVRNDFEIWSLDHDLRGCDFEDPDSNESGMEIVRYLEKTAWPEGKPKPYIWVHSSNLFAAELMVVRLNKIGFLAWQRQFVYEKVEHMKYDKDGLPV